MPLRLAGVLLASFYSMAAAISAFGQDAGRPVRFIGEFSNMRFTEEHAYGYTVQLWRDADSVIGLFLASEGLQGDTPTGMLEDVKYDPRTGALSFTARLTIGLVVHPGGRQEPSRDLFRFSGTLKPADLTGALQRSGTRHRIRLKLQPRGAIFAAGSYTEWKRQADEILKFRGPKW